MFDLFGLRKNSESEKESPVPSAAHTSSTYPPPISATPPAASQRPPDAALPRDSARSADRKRVWAVLLVLDTALLLILGGIVAGVLQMRRLPINFAPPRSNGNPRASKTAAPPQAAAPQEPAVSTKPLTTQEAEGKTSAPSPEQTPAGAPQPQDAQPSQKPSSSGTDFKIPIGSPGLAAPELPRREAGPAKSNGNAARSAIRAPIAKAAAKPRAQTVEFTHRAKGAREVLLKGAFLVRTGGLKRMNRETDGTWRMTISLLPGTYRYSFMVDGRRGKTQTIDVP